MWFLVLPRWAFVIKLAVDLGKHPKKTQNKPVKRENAFVR